MTWLVLSLLLGAALTALHFFERIQVYRPSRKLDKDPGAIGLEFEEIFFATEDGGRLHGWWIPHPRARGSVVYCHGNGGNIADRLAVAQGLHDFEVNVFLFDYRGYGKSRSFATEERTYRDACAAFEVVRAKHGDADEPPIIAFGASLGGAVAVELASRRPVCGLIVEGGFSSVTDVAVLRYPWLPVRLMTSFRYHAAGRVGQVSAPKLIAHSRDDEVIPHALGRFLYERAAEPKAFVDLRGDHGEAGWRENPAYASALRAFFDRQLPRVVQ